MKFACRLIALALLTFGTSQAFAACTYSTVQGKWAVTYADFDSNIGFSAYGIGRISFDAATKKVSLLGVRETSFGVVGSGTGSGTYTINSACQGVINWTVADSGEKIRYDFVVSGTADFPELNFIMSEPTNLLSGQGFMRKINL